MEELVEAIDETISSLKGIRDNVRTGYYYDVTLDNPEARRRVLGEIEEVTGYLREKSQEILKV